MMDMLWKCLAACFLSAVIVMLLKRQTPEISLLAAAAVLTVLCAGSFKIIGEIVGFFRELTSAAELTPLSVSVLMKCLAVGILTGLTCDFCLDAGQRSLASCAELIGTSAILYSAIPLMKTLLKMVTDLL